MANTLVNILIIGFLAAAYGSVLPKPQFVMDWDRNIRVVGGEPADITDAPYQVAMLLSRTGGTPSQSCGGSIIRPDVVVCAAHCPYGTTSNMWSIRAGSTLSSSGGQLIQIQRIVIHEAYSNFIIDFDISLFFLANAINIDGVTTAPILLPSQDASVIDGTEGLVTGWGSTREGGPTVPGLQKVTLPIVNQQVCATAYAGVNPITDRMICAGILETGGKDACQGDSGGPLAIAGQLIGITSWGVGCARAGYPGVWTRVSVFNNWIQNHLA